MTIAAIERIKEQLTAARAAGDRAEITRLYFSLPLSERNQPLTRPGGSVRIVGALARPAASSLGEPAAQSQSVAITPSVRDSLDDSFDGHEQGGFLIGPITSDGEIFATGTIAPQHDDAKRGRESIVLNLDEAVRILETLPSDRTIVGDWHVHPHDSNSQPSAADLRSWDRLAQFFDRPWVGIIARNAPVSVPGINGRLHATSHFEINATLTRHNKGRPDHRPIQVIERSY